MKIDFVVAWVDGGDPQWVEERNSYSPNSKINPSLYRDWDIFKYWFRAVEKYAPWVNNIYVVTYNQKPKWLNCEHPKIHLIDHKDYIPEKYLPTFSSHVIELNFHRIKELSEHFVYFNDDMYLSSEISKDFFFKNGKPCDSPIMSNLAPSVVGDPFAHYLCNNLTVINAHFKKKKVLLNNFFGWFNLKYSKHLLKNIFLSIPKKFTGFEIFHMPNAMLKSVYEEVWDKEYELLDETCRHKFRDRSDVSQFIISEYNLCKGNFHPRKTGVGKFITINNNAQEIYDCFKSGKYKMICINDNPNPINFEKEKESIKDIFERLFPEKSSFEV